MLSSLYNGPFSCSPRMKTAFFIFDLAETASVTAEMKSQLYTLAYTVSHVFCYECSLQSSSFFIVFNFLTTWEYHGVSIQVRCPVICILSHPSKPGAQQIQRDLFRDIIRSCLPSRSGKMPKANQLTPSFCYNYVVCAGLQTHAKRLPVLKSPLCTCPLCHYTVMHLSQQV